MDKTTIEQGLAVIAAAPAVTIMGLVLVSGFVWKLVDWAYRLRVEALNERSTLYKDRLVASNDELAQVRQKLENLEAKLEYTEPAPSILFERGTPSLKNDLAEAVKGLTGSMQANTVTISAGGALYPGKRKGASQRVPPT